MHLAAAYSFVFLSILVHVAYCFVVLSLVAALVLIDIVLGFFSFVGQSLAIVLSHSQLIQQVLVLLHQLYHSDLTLLLLVAGSPLRLLKLGNLRFPFSYFLVCCSQLGSQLVHFFVEPNLFLAHVPLLVPHGVLALQFVGLNGGK